MSGVLIPFLMPVYPGAFPTFTERHNLPPTALYVAALLRPGLGVFRPLRRDHHHALVSGISPPGAFLIAKKDDPGGYGNFCTGLAGLG
jgi:hypothetical protein